MTDTISFKMKIKRPFNCLFNFGFKYVDRAIFGAFVIRDTMNTSCTPFENDLLLKLKYV